LPYPRGSDGVTPLADLLALARNWGFDP
jgi:hypothetical protein